MAKYFVENVTLKKEKISMKKPLIKILFEHYNTPEGILGIESAWGESVGFLSCRLDNILFYAKEYSLNDILTLKEINGEFFVTGLLKPSGHSTVRILFNNFSLIETTRNELRNMNCESEISDVRILISVDVPPDVDYFVIQEYLFAGEAKGGWAFEEACIAHTR